MLCTYSSTSMQRLRRFENAFADCVDCRCCEIHVLNRPTALAPWPEVDEAFRQRTTPSNKLGGTRLRCPCPCRHNAREICRKVFGLVGSA